MPLTARRLNRATLARQLLLARERLDVVDAVHRIVALQAQEPASPYIALWTRLLDLDPADLDRAFAADAIVKASLMRITLHAVAAADYPAFHEAMQPSLRGSCLTDSRFTVAGLSVREAEALVPDLLAFAARPRSNADVHAWLDDRLGGPPRAGAWWALRRFIPVVHAPTGGAWTFGPRPAYRAARDGARTGEPDRWLQHLARRYLEGFGPASMPDLAQFAMVQRSRARDALGALAHRGEIATLDGPGGIVLFDVPGGPLPAEETPAPSRLLPMWDSVLLAYADRARIIPPRYRPLVTRTNGDVLPTLLVDGHVAGVWRPVEDGIEATAFAPISEDAWADLEVEARSLRAFLSGRDPLVYRRYGNWWPRLPPADGGVRVLAG